MQKSCPVTVVSSAAHRRHSTSGPNPRLATAKSIKGYEINVNISQTSFLFRLSRDSRQAWMPVQQHERLRVSLGSLGCSFVDRVARPEQEKEAELEEKQRELRQRLLVAGNAAAADVLLVKPQGFDWACDFKARKWPQARCTMGSPTDSGI